MKLAHPHVAVTLLSSVPSCEDVAALFKEAAQQFARARWPVDEAHCRAAGAASA